MLTQLCKVVCVLIFVQSATAIAETSLRADIAAHYGALQKLYEHLHRNPELSFHEEATSRLLAKQARKLGFKVTERVGGWGVVAVMRNGEGPTIMIRADMDGLPVLEQTGLAYASQVTTEDESGKTVPVMHACGHDVHMTAWVGTAQQLVARKTQWRGTLLMIAQPAEERGGGARAMLADGLFERFPRPDYNLAFHVSADSAAGDISYSPGFAFANVDSVDITVRGIGGHGARPESTKDPIVLAAQIVLALQTLVSREIAPIDPAVVTVGSIHGGTKHNIISDRVELQLTVRSYSDEVRQQILDGIRRIAVAQGRVAGLPEDLLPIVKFSDEYTPSLYNNPELSARIDAVLKTQLGTDRVYIRKPVMGGEDFGRYGRVEPRIPSLMVWVGSIAPERISAAGDSGKALPSLHSPFYAPLPEATISGAVEAMSASAMSLFAKP